MNVINGFVGANQFLSNFFPSPLQYGAIAYPSVEHAYQAAKAFSIAEKLKIAGAKTPGESKKLGRKVQLPEGWERTKNQIMLDLLILKFAPGTDLAYRLLATEDAELVEGNHWHDQFWGDCNCPNHYFIPGLNQLGIDLMKVRGYLSR